MKRALRYLAGFAIGAYYITIGTRKRSLRRYDSENSILSLMTHHPTPLVFKKTIEWLLKEGFHFVSTDDLLNNKIVDLHRKYGRIAWLTIDDCWEICKESVLPMIEKHSIPVTFFLPPTELERGILWRHSVWGKTDAETMKRLHFMPSNERYQKISEILGGMPRERVLMTKEEVVALSSNPLVTFENHTDYHESSVHWSVDDNLKSIKSAAKKIYEWTGRKTRLMCYPYGYYSDLLDKRIKEETGHLTVTCNPGVMTEENKFFVRNQIYDDMSFPENSCRIVGAWKKIKSQKSEQLVV